MDVVKKEEAAAANVKTIADVDAATLSALEALADLETIPAAALSGLLF